MDVQKLINLRLSIKIQFMKMILLFTFPILFGMCSNQPSNSPSSDDNLLGLIDQTEVEERSMAEPPPADPNAPPPLPPKVRFVSPEETTPNLTQKLIRTADMSMEVKDFDDSRKELAIILKKFDAQLSQEREQSLDYRIESQFVIRVKPMLLDSTIAAVGQLASNIYYKNITTEDVTRQYVDLESRLASKRAVIEQYRTLLKSAKKVSDILEISEKLNAVIEEIESTEAQLRTLRDQVQFSTLNLTIYQNLDNIAAGHDGFGSRLGNAFSNGWQGLLNVFVGIIYLWPLLIIMIIVLFFIIRANRKRNNRVIEHSTAQE